MKKVIVVIGICLALGLYGFYVPAKKAEARGGECNFDLDCGIVLKCVGSVGNKVCVPK